MNTNRFLMIRPAGLAALTVLLPMLALSSARGLSYTAPNALLFRDDFHESISPAWQITNPDPSRYSLSDMPGHLTIHSTVGDTWYSSNNVTNLFSLALPDSAEVLTVTTKLSFSTPPFQHAQQAGVILMADSDGQPDMDNYYRASYAFVDQRRRPTAVREVSGSGVSRKGPVLDIGASPIWIRIVKNSDSYDALYSLDGVSFSLYNSTTATFDVFHIGFFALNCQALPSIPVNFDYIDIRAPANLLPRGAATYSQVYTSTETLAAQRAVLTDTAVTGWSSGTLQLTSYESVLVSTGHLADKGFAKGNYQASLGGEVYSGTWQSVLSLVPKESRYRLHGSSSGGIEAVLEGFLSESVPGSGVHDHYQVTWDIGRLDGTLTSVSLEISGTLDISSESQYPDTLLRIMQAEAETVVYGNYMDPAGVVMTLMNVADSESPFQGEGFSYLTCSAAPGSGEGWSYVATDSPGIISLEGTMMAPFHGTLGGWLNETGSPATLSLGVERVDLGLPPAADLAIRTWGPQRVSPGQTINYVIEYRNEGVAPADSALVLAVLYAPAEFVSASPGWEYDDYFQSVSWEVSSLSPGASGVLSLQARIPWGLEQGTELGVSAYIVDAESPLLTLGASAEPANLFVNGINLKTGTTGSRKYSEFSRDQDAQWVPVYYSGSTVTDIANVYHATPLHIGETSANITPTDLNGLTEPLVTDGVYDTCYAYSGGTRTLITAIRLYNLQCNTVVLISPICGVQVPGTYKQELEDIYINKGVNKIIIYQSEKDHLDGGDLHQVYFDADDQVWLDYMNIDVHEKAIEGPAGREAHWELFWKVNEELKGREASSSSGLSTIAVARDPNAKSGPDGLVRPGQLLTYTLEYENEGEGIAFGVYFADTLDENLDLSTLDIGPVLDEGGQQIAGPGTFDPNTRTITWFVGEVGPREGGHAEVHVRVRADAPIGTEIVNYATVYFPSVPEVTPTNGVVSVVSAYVYLPLVVR